MKIIWEDITFNEQEILDAIKTKAFDSDSDDIPSTLFQGPFTVESVMDPMSFSKRHQPVMGHTDFNISERRAKLIMQTKGVDFYRGVSRYSFLFSSGKAFEESTVKNYIAAVLGVNQAPDFNIEEICYSLSKEGSYCVYIRDGEVHTVTELNPNFRSMVAVYKESQKKFGGEIHEG